MKKFSLFTTGAMIALGLFLMPAQAQAQIKVLTVDCVPFDPGFTNTMGQAIQAVDPGGVFNVTEVTPAAFRAMTAADLSAFNLIAVNNDFGRLGCDPAGLGTVWHDVVGVDCGGRIVLSSHDAPRFHMNFAGCYFAGCIGPGTAPYGADELVENAATWAGSGSGTGLLIFTDSNFFGGFGWDNIELSLPGAWGISNALILPNIVDGGYTDIVTGFDGVHPVYTTPTLLSDVRFAVNSINSFAANIGDASFHHVFATFNAATFTPSEVVINSGIINVGGLHPSGALVAPPAGSDGLAITLIRDISCDPGCTFTQGYWKNHNRFRKQKNQNTPWPIDEDTLLCGETWLDNLKTSPKKGNAFYILSHQWIAASLNVANGADDSDIAAELAEAEVLLNSCVFNTTDRFRAIELAGILGDFNEGTTGPGHCDDQ